MRNASANEFILACLQDGTHGDLRDRCASMIRPSLNWERITQCLSHAKILPVFFHRLQVLDLCREIPANVNRQLEKYCHKAAYQNMLILDQTARLSRLLAEEKIEAVLLKGAALQVGVWRDLCTREMADVDLLVEPADLEKTEKILLQNGYLPIEDWRSSEYYRRTHHHLVPYYNPNASYRIPLEVHHNIVQPGGTLALSMEDFIQSARAVEFLGSNYHVLSPENLLLHLCMQMAFAKNFLGQIRYCLDISQVLTRHGPEIEWSRIVAATRQHKTTNYIYYALHFTGIILNTPVPLDVLNRLRQEVTIKPLSDRILNHLVRRYILLPFPDSPPIPNYKLRLFIRDILDDARVADKFATIWNEIPILRQVKLGSKHFGTIPDATKSQGPAEDVRSR